MLAMGSKKGRLIVIAAPSGTGKGSILDYIKKIRPDIKHSISATTREPRDNEIPGLSYHFVSRERFKEMIDDDEFLEYAEYIGEFYGTPKKPIYELIDQGLDVVLEIEVQGAKQVMGLDFETLSIFIVPPDMDELERRLRGRGTDSEDNLLMRLKRASVEMEERFLYSHVVVNDDIVRAAEEILGIIDN